MPIEILTCIYGLAIRMNYSHFPTLIFKLDIYVNDTRPKYH